MEFARRTGSHFQESFYCKGLQYFRRMMMEKSDVVFVRGNIASAARLGIQKKPIERDYVLRHEIGSGGAGFVRLCTSKTNGAVFACKTIPKDQGDIDGNNVHREVEIMQHLGGHPGIVKLEAAYEDSNYFHLVLEFVAGGELLDHVNNLRSEPKSSRVIKELMVILRYCHGIGVVHRDIKPENILLTSSGSLKLADFGSAAWFLKGQSLSDNVGTAAFLAPEVLSGNYSEKVDVWSAGILLHCLLFGRLPYEEAYESKILKAVKNENLNFNNEEWESISTPAQDLIRKMLATDASARISAEEVLMHPWILMYTEQISENRNQAEVSPRQVGSVAGIRPERTDPSEWTSSTYCSIENSLSLELYNMRMKEPTLGRVCVPSSRRQPDSVKANNLCKAF